MFYKQFPEGYIELESAFRQKSSKYTTTYRNITRLRLYIVSLSNVIKKFKDPDLRYRF